MDFRALTTDDEIKKISTEAYMWTTTQGAVRHSEDTAVAYRVVGLPEGLKANLHVVRFVNSGSERWRFEISKEGQEAVMSDQPYGSKDEATGGLKKWLREHARR